MVHTHNAAMDGFEAWRHTIHSICGRYNAELNDTKNFSGWAKLRELSGLEVLDVACNVDRIARSVADTRRDDAEYFYMILQLRGSAVMIQNDSEEMLCSGDIALIDSTRPSNFVYANQASHQLSIHLPRRQCASYLGFQLRGGLKADRRLHVTQMVFNLFKSEENSEKRTDFSLYENLLIYDLLGALFAPSKILAANQTLHSKMLFNRVCEIINKHAGDSGLSIAAVAESAGISVRYLQKLFTERETSFSKFLETQRLDFSAAMLRRTKITGAKPAIGDIAAAVGFSSLPHFSRSFRKRFGHPPSLHV